jgi:hypothetical protein
LLAIATTTESSNTSAALSSDSEHQGESTSPGTVVPALANHGERHPAPDSSAPANSGEPLPDTAAEEGEARYLIVNHSKPQFATDSVRLWPFFDTAQCGVSNLHFVSKRPDRNDDQRNGRISLAGAGRDVETCEAGVAWIDFRVRARIGDRANDFEVGL